VHILLPIGGIWFAVFPIQGIGGSAVIEIFGLGFYFGERQASDV